jgi:hypothetical protein
MATAINYQQPTTPAGISVHDRVPYLGTATSLSAYNPPKGIPKSWTINFVSDDGTRIRAVLNEGRRYFELHLQ